MLERNTCPICYTEYIRERQQQTLIIRECSNNHSWTKYHQYGAPVTDEPPQYQQRAFDNVYRPFQDTQEPLKRLFS